MRGLIIIVAVAITATTVATTDEYLCDDKYGQYKKDQKWIKGSFVLQCQEVNDGSQNGWRIEILACLTTFYQEHQMALCGVCVRSVWPAVSPRRRQRKAATMARLTHIPHSPPVDCDDKEQEMLSVPTKD